MAELADRMDGTLEFGTAGLRGKVEAGSNRMNRAVVIRATRGVSQWVRRSGHSGPVVVGRDARLSSARFMEDTVGVLLAAGLPVRFFEDPVPTPVVAYMAQELEAAAAIVITASHNPPADNGYKVYASNGAQIIPPADTDISDAIARVGLAVDVPRIEDPYLHPEARAVPDARERYLEAIESCLPEVGEESEIGIVYTPLHGVGGPWTIAALRRHGFGDVVPVPEQYEPDGRFPTVAFPNPEEEGALDLAESLAAARGAHLVIANDPDTDRLAVSLPAREGGWRKLTGNQIGVLLADHLLAHGEVGEPIVVNSIVSSPMLRDLADEKGAVYTATLTGFKWIWNAVLDLEEAGRGRFLFGYEEALGYSVCRAVRDKDGISAAVAFAQIAGVAAASGRTVWDVLDDLYRRVGLWVSAQVSIVRPGSEGAGEISAAMEKLGREHPGELGGLAVTEVEDYRTGAADRPRWLPAAPLVELRLGGDGRALVRPSGTEPKLKIYVDLRAEAGADLRDSEARLRSRAERVARDLARFAGI